MGLKSQCTDGPTSIDYENFLLALCSHIQMDHLPSEGKVPHSQLSFSTGSVWVLVESDNPTDL